MTVEQKFTRWVKYSILIFVLVFGYFLFADSTLPLTPQAMVTRNVTKIVPQVSGNVVALYVKNSQVVEKGELLFSIDPAPYELALEKSELAVALAQQANLQLDASLAAAQANYNAIKIVAEQKLQYAQRLSALFIRHGVSQQTNDDAQSDAVAEQANLLAAKAEVKQLQVSRGLLGRYNLNLQVAQNQLKQAKLNLSYSQVHAKQDGIVTNLQLAVGTYATAGQPLLALVSTQSEVIADFREKSSRDVVNGSRALVAFDSFPGQLFPASLLSLDAGVSVGQFDANGSLATPSSSTRWVRDAQRMRLHFILDKKYSHFLPAGAQATVQLLPKSKLLAHLAKWQIQFLSLLHYVY